MRDCYCCSEKPFSSCCEPYLNLEKYPSTAEKLMRSRYSAFATTNINYLLLTSSAELKKRLNPADLKEWSLENSWKGLKIIQLSKGSETDDKGMVEFIAYFIDKNGNTNNHHEISWFQKEENKWVYHEGDIVPKKSEAIEVGRNTPCPCGSNKKYKKCCGK